MSTIEELSARIRILETKFSDREARIRQLRIRWEALRDAQSQSLAQSSESEEVLRKKLKPVVDAAEVEALIHEHWGLELAAPPKELVSYDDVNFLCTVSAGSQQRNFTLKVHNGVESRNLPVIEAQNAIMVHLSDCGVVCPVPQPSISGSSFVEVPLRTVEWEAAGLPGATKPLMVVRLLSWVEGGTLCDAQGSETLLEEAGRFLGGVSSSLVTFHHDACSRKHAWDLQHAMDLCKFTRHIPDAGKRGLVEGVLSKFASRVLPVAQELPSAVIMGDFNDANIIVATGDHVAGIIDFGDIVRTWRVNEVAIAMAYAMLTPRRGPVAGAIEPGSAEGGAQSGTSRMGVEGAIAVLRGFSRTFSELTDTEVSLLEILPACRLACSFTLGMYSYSQNPTNQYLLHHAVPAAEALEEWTKASEAGLAARIKDAVQRTDELHRFLS